MSERPRPVLNQVNILATDWAASLEFYWLLGVEVPEGASTRRGPAHGTRRWRWMEAG
jgi:hypothetical protein